MYALGCTGTPGCRVATERLGVAPLAVVMTVNQAAALLGLNSSDPKKDQERIDRINGQYNSAMAGDQSAVACLKDMAAGVSSGPNDPRQCAVGSAIAAGYAKVKWAEYQGRVAAGIVGGTLIQQSNIPTTILGVSKSVLPYVAVGVVALLMLRRRR